MLKRRAPSLPGGMVRRDPVFRAIAICLFTIGAVVMLLPVWYAAAIASMTEDGRLTLFSVPGPGLIVTIAGVLADPSVQRQLFNSLIMAVGITAAKIAVSLTAGFAIVYFRFRGRNLAFWAIFFSLMLPVEVRIVPTYAVAADPLGPLVAGLRLLGIEIGLSPSLLDTHAGLILPLIASATATFLYRQVFLSVPGELVEAARIDGAGPLRFLRDIALPLAAPATAALTVILFVYGWNQYLWPLLITTDERMATVVMGVARTLPSDNAETRWGLTMGRALVAMAPPVILVILLQRRLVAGLTDVGK
ncbi:ABC transporter permease subunit [Tistrella bauzanensis]|uniref:sn-glycerol-3-phosphate transport system permease protein UgpE n=1 Tax=Tistrella arctica TaxID=3133430 RepID=A0ABU9YH37_9PROT